MCTSLGKYPAGSKHNTSTTQAQHNMGTRTENAARTLAPQTYCVLSLYGYSHIEARSATIYKSREEPYFDVVNVVNTRPLTSHKKDPTIITFIALMADLLASSSLMDDCLERSHDTQSSHRAQHPILVAGLASTPQNREP